MLLWIWTPPKKKAWQNWGLNESLQKDQNHVHDPNYSPSGGWKLKELSNDGSLLYCSEKECVWTDAGKVSEYGYWFLRIWITDGQKGLRSG